MKSNNTVVFLYVKTLSHGDLPKKDYIILTCQTYRRAIEKASMLQVYEWIDVTFEKGLVWRKSFTVMC